MNSVYKFVQDTMLEIINYTKKPILIKKPFISSSLNNLTVWQIAADVSGQSKLSPIFFIRENEIRGI
jgi:hypothetical protein